MIERVNSLAARFEERVRAERLRLAELLKESRWELFPIGLATCPLCGAAVASIAAHRDWHMRVLQ